MALIPSLSIRQMMTIFFLELSSKDYIKFQEKINEVVALCSRPSQNLKLDSFKASFSCSDGNSLLHSRF